MIYVPPLLVRILNRLKLMTILRIGYYIRILNKKYKIPVIENKEGLFYNLKVDELFFLHVLQQLFKHKQVLFLDAGVNFGQTLLKVKAINATTSYIGFEPSGLCSYYTSHLIKVNHLQDAKLIRCALGDHAEVLTLYGPAEGDTRSSLLEDFNSREGNRFKELVPVVTLDSLEMIIASSGNKEIILKIDVEGAEWMVLQGGNIFIDRYRPTIIFENLPNLENVVKQQIQQKLSNFFESKSYKLHVLDDYNKMLRHIKAIDNKHDYSLTNYLAIPIEKTDAYELTIEG